jgi:LacI family transcriptional regulator, repressor for deo operon, udp, cdd, tsx, nupC, and nupG
MHGHFHMSGRRIPDEVAVAGFDGVDLAAFINPPLTTVQVPYWKMANQAALLINRYLETGEFPREKIVEPTQLIIRESTWAGKSWNKNHVQPKA